MCGGRLFAFWRRRRKVAVRNLRRPVAGEHYECANIWPFVFGYYVAAFVDLGMLGIERSEEHTSELQSLMRTSYAVFCLKKKINISYDVLRIKTKNTITTSQ